MAERALSTDIKKLLLNNEAFTYAHLVKFERPSKELLNGTFSTDAKRYAYYTDSTFNVDFNDASLDTLGNANGSQTYVADKILEVGTYSETVEAKASGMNIKLSSETLNNSITNSAITMTSSTITVPAHIDLANEGFREGDKVLISGGANNGHEVRVTGIKTNNTVLVVSNIDSTLGTQSTGTSITLKIVSDELSGPLTEINDSGSLKSYHNREVFVYKAFLDGATIVGDPVLIFKGIIQSASMAEAPDKNLQVTWNLTSHWGDFAQVKGRMSNDKIHRAVDSENRGQEKAALRPEYANDLGFMHAEQTTNILATYTAIEQEMKVKVKKKWFGFKTKVTTEMVDVEVQRDVNLDFSLSSHFIPVVYGIDRIQGKPIFVDTKSNDPNNIFIAYSLCEGQIGGLYDLYIDGNPLVCINKEDSDDRNDATGASKDNVEVFCRGRQDLGTTLGGVKMSGSGVSGSNRANYGYRNSFAGYGRGGFRPQQDYIEAQDVEYFGINESLLNVTANDANGGGVLDGETVKLSAPNTMRITLHTGKKDQKADDTLTSIAVSPKFKRQVDYFNSSEEEGEYWSPAHKLLDTAYVVLDCEIAEDATTVPEIEYVVRGKSISCYNYDYSYDHTGASGQAHTNFNVGDKVTLKRTSDNSTLNADVIIIDKWSFADTEGNLRYRFRYSTAPDLNYSDGIPQITAFYHTDGTNSWNMVTYNHEAETGTVPATLSVTTTVTANTGSALTANTGSNPAWLNNPYLNGAHFNFFFEDINLPYFRKNFPFTLGGTTLTATGTNAEGATGGSQTLVSADKIKLGSGASSSDNAYNGYTVELTKTFTDSTGTQKQKVERVISAYDGSERVATVTSQWPAGMAPDPDDVVQESGAVYTYRLLPKSTLDDKRVSINPAIQLLDYMTAKTYGKDLDIDTDIAMSDFLLSARACDDKGTQTLVGLNTLPTVGDRYVLTSNGTTSGSVVAMGLVKSVGTYSNNVKYAVMQQCFGKFSKRFMAKTHSYSVGDIIYTGHANGYTRVTSAGTINSSPVGNLTSISLFKLVNGAPTSTSFTVSNNNGGYYNYVGKYNATTKAYDTGYSIFDSDNVQYWRYLGWNSHHQREVTRHQCMGSVDTSQSVFANINGFLKNFNGMLSYEAGQYALRIETTSEDITSQIATSSDTGYTVGAQKNSRWIDESDIIGNISVKDGGTKKSYNTVSTSIEDPGNQFKNTAVTFYDSNYLRADKNVIKTGTVAIPAVASYYNARINVENFLRKSRFGLSISFTMGPKALMLLAGETIAFSHEKFGWYGKKFRITNISYNKNCNANITAEEYDDSFYTITAPSLPSVSGNDQRQGLQASPGVPGSPTATAGALGTIEITWPNNSVFTDNMFTEIHVSPDSNTNNRTLLTKTDGATAVFTHNVGEDNATRYYWIRHGKRVVLTSGGQNKVKVLYSNFVGPDNATTVIPSTWYKVAGSSNFGAFKFSADGNTKTPSAITITADRINLSAAASFTATNNSGASVTLTGSGDTRSLTSANFGSADFVNVTISVTSTTAERNAGADDTYTDVVSIQKIQDGLVGSNGNDAKTVKLTAADYSIVYNAAGNTPSPSSTITLTATAQGFTNPYFKFTGDGISDESSFSDGASATNDTFTFSVPSSVFTTPKSLRVGVSEADQTEVAFDTISIFAVQPGAAGDDGDDAFTVICTNESHAVPADNDGGNPVMTGTGTSFEVFRGSTQLTGVTTGTPTANQFKVTVASDTNITAGAQSASSQTIVFADHTSMNAPTANIVYSVNIANTQTVTKKQSFSRTNKGNTGDAGTAAFSGFLTNENTSALAYNFISEILVYTGTGGEFKTFDGTTEITSGVTYGGGATKNDLTLAINSSTGVYTLTGASWSTDAESFDLTATRGSDVLTKTFSINKLVNQGKVEIVSTGNQFSYDNLSANPSPSSITLTAEAFGFNLSPQYKWEKSTNAGSSFTTISNFSNTAAITVSAGAYSTGSELYRLTMRTAASGFGNASVDTDSITIGRIKDGATGAPGDDGDDGDDGDAGLKIAEVDLYYELAAGSYTLPNSAPSTGTYNFGTNVVASIPTGWSQTKPAVKVGQLAAISKTLATEATSGGNVSGSLTWTTPTMYSGGAPTTDFIFKYQTAAGSAPSATGYNASLPSGWSTTIPSNPNDGKKLFSSKGVATLTGSYPNFAFNFVWQTPVLQVQGKTDVGLGSVADERQITIFRQTSAPTALAIGDMWFDTNDGNQLYRAESVGANEVTAGEWVSVIDEGGRRGRVAFSGTFGQTPVLNVANANSLLKNATIEVDGDGKLTGIGTADIKVNNAKTTYSELNGTKPPSDANKVDVTAGTDGRVQVAVNGATASNINVFSTADRQKLTNLRAGNVPGNGTDTTTASIANEDIGINTTTGVLSGIGTGNSSRVFNDVIGVTLDTTTNVGRITLAGVGADNTTVDVTKSNLGLSYDDGATVGAKAGTNLIDSGGSSLNDVDVRNSDLDVDYSGTTIRIKKGTAVINSVAAPSALKNADVTATDIGGSGYVLPTSGATVGATLGVNGNLFEENGTTKLTDEKVKNDSLSLAYDGTNIQIKRGTTQIGSDVDAPNDLKNTQISLTASGGTVTLNNANATNKTITKTSIALDQVTNDAQVKDDLSNLNVTSADLEVVDVSGTKKLQAKNALKNAQIKIKADGTLRYDGGAGGTPSLASIGGIVSKTGGGFGTDVSSAEGVVDFTTGTPNFRTSLPKTRGGFGEDISAKSGVLSFSTGTASFDSQLPLSLGGFGVNVTTLFGTAGKLPRWNGSAWESLAETNFKNDEIIDSSGNIKESVSISLPGGSTFSAQQLENVKSTFDNIDNSTTIKLDAAKVPIDTNFLEVDSGNIKISDNAIGGDQISSSTSIIAGTSTNVAGLDGGNNASPIADTVRIFAGTTLSNKVNAPFRVTQDGALSATSTTLGSTSGIALNVSTGSKTVQINTPSSTSGTVFQAGGDSTTSYVPLKVLGDGSGVIRGFDIFTSDGTKIFDKASGLTDAAITVVAQATGSAVSTISKTTNSENAADAQKITNGTSSQTVTVKLTKDGDGMIGFSTTSGTVAANQIPTTVVVKLFKSANADLSSPQQLGSTRTLTKNGTESNIATDTFFVSTESDSEPGFSLHFATVPSSNSSSSSNTPFDASGNIILEATDSLSANQVVYYFTEITGSAGNGAGSNNVTNTASRSITVTAATGNTFTIDESGDSTGSTAEGDITAVVAGTGMTGGATSGSATLNVVGGDGITANADEIEVAVDNTTIELSATSGSGTVRAKTAAIANSGTALATADQIHTFVTGQGYITGITSSNVTTALGFTPTSYSNSSVDTHLNRSSASSGQILSWNGSDYAWVADQTGSGSGLPSGMTYSSSILDVTGSVRATGDVIAYHSSDIRFKDNIKIIDNAVDKVLQIRGVEFDWNDKQSMYEGHDIGVIAQEVEAVAPEIVVTREDGYKAVDYQKLTALLIEAVKELKEEIKELKKDK